MTKRRKLLIIGGYILAAGVGAIAGQVVGIQKVPVLDYFGYATTPGNPPVGSGRVYYNTTTSQLTCLTSSGASCLTGGGGGTVTAVTGVAPITSTGGATPAIGCATCVTQASSNTSGDVITGAGGQAVQDSGVTLTSVQSPAFSAITSGTNTAAAMVLGSGSSLTVSGTGTNNATTLGGATFAAPGPIGSTTASTGAFSTLSASSTVSGTGFSTYLASPPAIGGTAAAAGTFTTLKDTSETCGIIGTTTCVITFNGGTSGSATITGPAVAGTNTNPFVFSNAVQMAAANPSLIFNGEAFYPSAAGVISWDTTGTTDGGSLYSSGVRVVAGAGYDWSSTSSAIGTPDTSLGRLSAGIVTVDTTTIGNGAGQINAHIVGLNGSTSGTATFTAPAIAGTTSNPVVASNSLQITSTVSGGTPQLAFNDATTGWQQSATGVWKFYGAGTDTLALAANILRVNSSTGYQWSSGGSSSGTADTGLGRSAAGIVSIDTGTIGNAAGTLKAAVLQAGGFTGVSIGTPTQVYNTAATAQSASIAATTMLANPATDRNYTFHVYIGQVAQGTTCTIAGSVAVNILYTDAITGNAYTFILSLDGSGGTGVLASVPLSTSAPTVANVGSGVFQLRAKASTNVQYSTTYSAGTCSSGSPSYSVFPVLEAL
jgi:hypothetical protein